MTSKIENFVVNRKMLEQMTWKSTFANYISKLLGHRITEEHVHSDENSEDFWITPKSLLLNHPLLLVNHHGYLVAIIPYKDYRMLNDGEIHPLRYITGAHWSYGKYSKGEGIRGIFWKPLETEGICNTEKISMYLNQIRKVDIHPEDYRQKLFSMIEKRIREELKINASDINFMGYDGENALLVADHKKKDVLTCYLPAILLNDILYHPGERDWETFANVFQFELGVSNSRRKRYIVPNGVNKPEFCRRVWRNLGLTNWYSSEPIAQEETKEQEQEQKQERNKIFGFLKKFSKSVNVRRGV